MIDTISSQAVVLSRQASECVITVIHHTRRSYWWLDYFLIVFVGYESCSTASVVPRTRRYMQSPITDCQLRVIFSCFLDVQASTAAVAVAVSDRIDCRIVSFTCWPRSPRVALFRDLRKYTCQQCNANIQHFASDLIPMYHIFTPFRITNAILSCAFSGDFDCSHVIRCTRWRSPGLVYTRRPFVRSTLYNGVVPPIVEPSTCAYSKIVCGHAAPVAALRKLSRSTPVSSYPVIVGFRRKIRPGYPSLTSIPGVHYHFVLSFFHI